MNTQVNTAVVDVNTLPSFVVMPVVTKTLTELEEQQKQIKAEMAKAKQSMATRNEAIVYNKDAAIGRAIRLAIDAENAPMKDGEPPRKKLFNQMFVHILAELQKVEAADNAIREAAKAARAIKNANAKAKSDATKAAKKATQAPVAVKPATPAPITTKFTPNPTPTSN
jgi:ABC-type transporter MlaC component